MRSVAAPYARCAAALALVGLLVASCHINQPASTAGKMLQMPGTEAIARALTRQGAIDAKLLRFLGMQFSDLAAFDKDKDGRLVATEVATALDLNPFDVEEITAFYAAGPDKNRTLAAGLRPRADRNGDGRLTRQEWLFEGRDALVRQLTVGFDKPETIGILWARRELLPLYQPLAPNVFALLDVNPKDDRLTNDEITAVGGSARLFEASSHGTLRPVDQQVFAAMLQDSRATLLRQLGTVFRQLDRNQDALLTKTELAAGVNHAEYGSVLAVVANDRDSLTRFEFERLILRTYGQPAVQRAVVRWTWPTPAPVPSPAP